MPITDKTTKLYENLKADNYAVGTMDEFTANLADAAKRKTLFERMKADNYALTDFAAFDAAIWRPDVAANIEAAVPEVAIAEPRTPREALSKAFDNPPTFKQASASLGRPAYGALAEIIQNVGNFDRFIFESKSPTIELLGAPFQIAKAARMLASHLMSSDAKRPVQQGGMLHKVVSDLRLGEKYFADRGLPKEAGAAYRFADKLNAAVIEAGVDIGVMIKTGGMIPFMTVMSGGAAAGQEGATPLDVGLASGKGFVVGTALHYTLKGLGFFRRAVRVPVGAIIGAGMTAVDEMQKPKDERDYMNIVVSGLVMGGMSVMGNKGASMAEVKRMFIAKYGSARMKAAAAKVKTAMEAVEVDQKAAVEFDALDKALNSPTANPVDAAAAEQRLTRLPEEFQQLPSAQDWADLHGETPLAQKIKGKTRTQILRDKFPSQRERVESIPHAEENRAILRDVLSRKDGITYDDFAVIRNNPVGRKLFAEELKAVDMETVDVNAHHYLLAQQLEMKIKRARAELTAAGRIADEVMGRKELVKAADAVSEMEAYRNRWDKLAKESDELGLLRDAETKRKWDSLINEVSELGLARDPEVKGLLEAKKQLDKEAARSLKSHADDMSRKATNEPWLKDEGETTIPTREQYNRRRAEKHGSIYNVISEEEIADIARRSGYNIKMVGVTRHERTKEGAYMGTSSNTTDAAPAGAFTHELAHIVSRGLADKINTGRLKAAIDQAAGRNSGKGKSSAEQKLVYDKVRKNIGYEYAVRIPEEITGSAVRAWVAGGKKTRALLREASPELGAIMDKIDLADFVHYEDAYPKVEAAPTKAPVEAPVAASSAKQPWEMTKAEYNKVRQPQMDADQWNEVQKMTIAAREADPKLTYDKTRAEMARQWTDKWHKFKVEEALADGKPVPAEVLADYPDLVRQAEASVAVAASADAIDDLVSRYIAAGYSAERFPKHKTMTVDGVGMSEKKAVAKMEAALSGEVSSTNTAVESRIKEINDELARLQSQYEKKMEQQSKSGMVPPPIKKDVLNGIAKKMDKLDAELLKLESTRNQAAEASTVHDVAAEPQFKSVVTNLGKALGETAKGIHESQGGGRVGILPYSELNYTNAKPHFQAAWEAYKAAGRDFKAFSDFMLSKYGSDITPYLHRVYADVGSPVVVMTSAGAVIAPEAELSSIDASGAAAAANKRTATAVAQQVSRIRKEDWSKLSRKHQENRITKADEIINKERSLTEADTDYRDSLLRVLKPKDVAVADARLRGEAWDKLAADVQRKRTAAAKEAILDPKETPEAYVAAINEVRGMADEKFMQQYVGVEYYTSRKPETVIALDVNGNPITAYEMDLLADLGKADALTRPYMGTSAQFFSEEVPLTATKAFNELVRYPMMENSKRIHVDKHNIISVDYRKVMKEAKKLGLSKDWRNRIANWGHTFRDASGEEAMKRMGKTPLKTADMTAGELKLIEYYQSEYKRLRELSNEAFRISGMEEMGESPNYFPAMRALILEKGHHFSSPEFVTKTQTPMPFAKEFTKSKLPLVMDADYIFRTYVTKSLEHIHRTPTHKRIRALLQHTFVDTNGSIVADARTGAPNIVKYASGMIDRAAGLRKSLTGVEDWDFGMRMMNTLHRNVIVSTLSYNLQSWAVQPSAVMGTMHKGGVWNSLKAAKAMALDKRTTTQAINESHALAPRFGEFYNAEIGDSYGARFKRLQTAVAKPGTKPMEWGDYWTAVHSYLTGKNKAADLGLTGDAAVRYADDFMLSTQSSLDITNRPPMYGTIEGRILGVLSSFSVNDVTRFKREVLGIGANAKMSAAQVAWATWRWMFLATLVNTGYELVGSAFPSSGIRRPVPLSLYDIIYGIKNAREQDHSALRGAAEGVAMGLYDLVPFGGPRYDVGGPLGGLQKQIAQTLTGNKQAQPIAVPAAKILGIPMASQATKTWRAIKKQRAEAAKAAAPTSRYKRAERSSSTYKRSN